MRIFERLEQVGIEIPTFIKDPQYLPRYNEVNDFFERIQSVNVNDGEFWCHNVADATLFEWARHGYNTPNRVYEIFNVEMIDALVKHISTKGRRILEVGAGDGKLAHYLRLALQRLGDFEYYAIDNGASKITPLFEVTNMDLEEGLKTYQPDVVIWSWMPYMYDGTRIIRNASSVREYILIGEGDGGSCGHPETWGHIEGWERRDLEEVGEWQMGRGDYPCEWVHSHTNSFTRI